MTDPFCVRRRRKGPVRSAAGCLLAVAALWLLATAIEIFWQRFDERRFRWAYARWGNPTLTGTWVGRLTTDGGAQLGMYLDLRLEPIRVFGRRERNVRRRARAANFEGEVRLCGGPAGEQRFAFDGTNDNAAASVFHLGLYPADSVPPDGFAPSHMRGRWDLRDSLLLEADMYFRRGKSAISGSDDPHTGRPAHIGMRRGGEPEFRAVCNSILGTPVSLLSQRRHR